MGSMLSVLHEKLQCAGPCLSCQQHSGTGNTRIRRSSSAAQQMWTSWCEIDPHTKQSSVSLILKFRLNITVGCQYNIIKEIDVPVGLQPGNIQKNWLGCGLNIRLRSKEMNIVDNEDQSRTSQWRGEEIQMVLSAVLPTREPWNSLIHSQAVFPPAVSRTTQTLGWDETGRRHHQMSQDLFGGGTRNELQQALLFFLNVLVWFYSWTVPPCCCSPVRRCMESREDGHCSTTCCGGSLGFLIHTPWSILRYFSGTLCLWSPER